MINQKNKCFIINIANFFIFIMFLSGHLEASPRDDAINRIKPYVSWEWKCKNNNLLDIYDNASLPSDNFLILDPLNKGATKQSDTIDDRRGKSKDPNLWPYETNKDCVGIAYAFGHMDSVVQFDNKIKDPAKNWIAGARGADWSVIPSTKYKGYVNVTNVKSDTGNTGN